MLLLSKFFPRLKLKGDKSKGVLSEAELLSSGEKHFDCNYRIVLLDDTEFPLNVKSSAKGSAVLDKVYDHLNLIEKDYFGLRYLDGSQQTHWLDPAKNVGSQLKTPPPHKLYFGVKFYAADPCKLNEEITRYQFFMQVKRDVLQGRLPVAFDMAAELAAYSIQSELGDYDTKRHSVGYVSEFRFIPNQTEEFELRASQLHKMLMGQVPAVAEYRYLDKVKWMEMYGVDLHSVQGDGNIDYFLGLTPTGIVVYRNKSKVGNYFWPRLTKITFKAKFFMVRVRDKNNDENTYAFECVTKAACKHLWRCCVEHHAFFRLTSAHESFSGGKLLNFGSKFRYSGRTERQVLSDSSSRAPRPSPSVVRVPSRRHQRRHSGDPKANGFAAVPKPQSRSESNLPSAANKVTTATTVTAEQIKCPSQYDGYYSVADSPRSTRSAPWMSGAQHKGGLYTGGRESPLSVRSEKMMFPRRVPSGSESETGNARRRPHYNRLESETESETEAQRRRRRRMGGGDTESESEANYRQRHRRSRKSTESLPYTESQWKQVQHRVRDGTRLPPDLLPNGSMNSMASEPAQAAAARRRRKRSRSPGNKPPEELAQHFKYIDPEEAGMTEDQLKDIAYTKVETVVNAPKVRHSKRRSCGELSEKSLPSRLPIGEAPPPYTENRRAARNSSQPNLHYAQHSGAAAAPRESRDHGRRSRDRREARQSRGPSPGESRGASRGELRGETRRETGGEVRGDARPQRGARPAPREVEVEMLQSPMSVHTQQTHSAPIVKTKPLGYASPMAAATAGPTATGMGAHTPQEGDQALMHRINTSMSQQQMYQQQHHQQQLHQQQQQQQQPPLGTPPAPASKHPRDDSGLGADQEGGSIGSSSSRVVSPAGNTSLTYAPGHDVGQGQGQGHMKIPMGYPASSGYVPSYMDQPQANGVHQDAMPPNTHYTRYRQPSRAARPQTAAPPQQAGYYGHGHQGLYGQRRQQQQYMGPPAQVIQSRSEKMTEL